MEIRSWASSVARASMMSMAISSAPNVSLPVHANTIERTSRRSKQLAVIGAGAAGLVAARELRREGHEVVVFERLYNVGGIWNYDPNIESDLLGIDSSRDVVHGSLYKSLRTNLPREVMGFRDYPFIATENGLDSRRFPTHREVCRYLHDFSRDFNLMDLIRLGTEVFDIGLLDDGGWMVKSRSVEKDSDVITEVYDGVVVCNGHYTEPRIAEIPGVDKWPGKQMHSHNYRVPDQFQGQVAVLIGNSASAVDISKDIYEVTKEVHIASRSTTVATPIKQPGYENMWLHSMIESAHEDGTIVFQDGSSVVADVILHCTGYKYHFPFLKTNGIVTVDDNCVGPLYKHVFPPSLAPWLSFIGLPWKVAPFPLFELQSKWLAGILSGWITLPSEQEMMDDVKAFYLKLESIGYPKRYTHNLTEYQFDYDDWLASKSGCPEIEEWRKQMYMSTSQNRKAHPETYRDEWDDHYWISHAHEDFSKVSCANNSSQ